jgi:hypothetical protein
MHDSFKKKSHEYSIRMKYLFFIIKILYNFIKIIILYFHM